MEVSIPRDRQGRFDLAIDQWRRRVSGFDDEVIARNAGGTTSGRVSYLDWLSWRA